MKLPSPIPALASLVLPTLAPSAAAVPQVWTQVTTPVDAQLLVTDPTDGEHLLVSESADGVQYETFNGGTLWTPMVLPSVGTGVVRSAYHVESGGDLVCRLSRTQNAMPLSGPIAMVRMGGAWQPIGPDVAPSPGTIVTGSNLVRGRLDPQRLSLGAVEADSFGESHRVLLSSDGGQTWSAELPGSSPFEIVEGPGEPYLLGASTSINPFPFTLVSRSSGFDAPTAPIYGGFDLQFGMAAKYPLSLWAITNNSNTENLFERSFDGGTTWTTIAVHTSFERLTNLLVHPARPGCAVASRLTGEAVMTTDGGATFTTLGGPYLPSAFAEDGRFLYAKRFVATGIEIHRIELFPSVGTSECSAQINGSGFPASIEALGSSSVGRSGLALVAVDVTPYQFGYFIVSQNAGFVANPGGSFGDLCLSGSIGRYVQSIQNAGPHGRLFGAVDLGLVPSPSGPVAAQQGQTWRFQAWFRDVAGGTPGSNFSDAVAVTLTP